MYACSEPITARVTPMWKKSENAINTAHDRGTKC